MTTPLALSTNRSDDGTLLLTAAGELDLSNVDTFAQALTDAINDATKENGHAEVPVTVDFSGVEYLDSSAINVLFTHADRIQTLVINHLLASVVTISGLDELITVEPMSAD